MKKEAGYNFAFFSTFLTIVFALCIPIFFSNTANAQFQEYTFSGNSRDNYQCFYKAPTGELISFEPSTIIGETGRYLCRCNLGSIPVGAPGFLARFFPNPTPGQPQILLNFGDPTLVAGTYQCNGQPAIESTLKPPKLQQLEIWFVRVIYIMWAFSGSFSIVFLIVLGYRYMISRGDVTKITEIRQRIVNYIVGFALTFLAVPVLTTVFRLFNINTAVQCYDVNMPGFQFFFVDLCTTPEGNVLFDDGTGVISPVSPRDV